MKGCRMHKTKHTLQTRSAFTLVETLIVVTVLAILASVVLTSSRARDIHSLEAAARILAADLRLARSLAIQYDTEWTVQFDRSGNAYELIHTGTGNPPPLKNPLAPPGQEFSPYRINLDDVGNKLAGGGGNIRLAGAGLNESLQSVGDVTFGPLGGTGPTRSEDTHIWLVQRTEGDDRFIRASISWITGQVWLTEPRMRSAASADPKVSPVLEQSVLSQPFP